MSWILLLNVFHAWSYPIVCTLLRYQSFLIVVLFMALHNVVTILSESILRLCWHQASLWSAHHISMWCKRPGDGDYLVDDRSCFERFFCACSIRLIWLVSGCLALKFSWFLNFLCLNAWKDDHNYISWVSGSIVSQRMHWLIVLILFCHRSNLSSCMTPTKILCAIIMVASLGLVVLVIQLTSGVSDFDPSAELQEAMPALQQWNFER